MTTDINLASMQWSGQRLLVKAALEGKRYQTDELSAHHLIWKTMGAAGDDG